MRLKNTTIAILALASIALLPACTSPGAQTPPDPAPAATTSEEPADEAVEDFGDLGASCEAFNDLAERLRSADESADDDVFVELYQDASDQASVAPEELRGALTAAGLIALDRDGGEVPQEDKDLYLQEAQNITPICADEGVQIVF